MNYNFNHILYIAPEDLNGGIGAVLKIYNNNIDTFKLISTSNNTHILRKIYNFFITLILFLRIIYIDKSIKIIHLHSASNGSFIRKSFLGIIGKFAKKKVIIHLHGGSFDTYSLKTRFNKFIIKYILQNMDIVICLTSYWDSFLINNFKLNNTFILGNPIELNPCINTTNNVSTMDISQIDLNTRYINYSKFSNDSLQLLFLGSINSKKGIFDLIDYLKSNFYFKIGRITLLVGGTGDIITLNKHISTYNFQIKYIGWVSGLEKAQYLQNCDIFILPSYTEGLPVSILEAISFSKPIIATNVGGIPTLVQNKYNGWTFEPGKFNQLDQIFEDVFSNTTDMNLFKKNSLIIANKFSVNTIFTNLSNLYSSMV